MTQSVVGALRVVLGLDTAQFEKGLTAAQKQLRGVAKSMQQTGNSMMQGGAAMTIGITAPFIALMTTSRQAAIESRTAVGQVESALASMGNAAGRSQSQLEDQAKALQALSVFDDDDVLAKVTANLLTFGKVSGTVFDRAQLAAVNLSARLGTDLQGSTLMLGKALNDPVKGMTALTRAGVSLDKTTQDRIKSLVKQGHLEQAQIILLQEVERQFNGAAAAQRAADPDSAARDSWREMQETLGDIAIRVLPPLTAALVTAMDAFNHLSPEMQATVVGGVAIAAALGPVVTVLGAVVTAGGGLVGVLSKVSLGTTAAAGGTSLLGAAMGALRGAMLFLVTTPWGLLITGIAVAVGLLVMKSREASPAQKELAKSTDAAREAVRLYQEAADKANLATGQGKTAAEAEARARRVNAVETLNETREKLKNARASLAQAAAARAAFNARLANAGEGMGTYARASSRGPRTMGDNQIRQLREQIAADTAAEKELRDTIGRIDVGMNTPAGGLGAGSGSGDDAGGRSGPSAEQLAQEREQRRRTSEDMAYQVNLQEAQLKNDLDRVQVLEREEAVRQRTRALIDGGILKDAEAAEEAERVQKRLDAAQEAQLDRARIADRRQHDMTLNTLDGREDLNTSIERQIQYEERLAFWQGQQLDLLSAQAAARLDMAQLDAARAAAAERTARAAAAQFELEKARLRGDSREVRRLSREAEIDARTRDYQTREHNPLDPDAARRLAASEVGELDDAEMQGKFRDFIKDGWRAAMDGDLSEFARGWVTEWAGRGLEDALNSLADLLMQVFKNADWGSMFGQRGSGAGGGGFDWGSIGSAVTSWFKKIPGFANGGSILPGGSGGVDSQLVQFRKSPGERVDIYTPGQDMRGNGETTNLVVTPSPYFDVQVKKVAGPMVVQGATAAYGATRADQVSSARRQRQRFT